MSEVTDLTVIEIKPEQAPVLYVAGGLDAYLEQIRQAVNEVEGKHYRHVAPDMAPKQNSPIMYNRDEINHWIEHQSPAKRRRISA
ncbi:excisionase family protein [Enterobacter hormaechei]|uniref:excisionase family protein n=1 Tax=Enterobacter hormaechei TaxID=158836 RepID=UPI002073D0DA|nr:excisionase family protein [Enterobacter hormaechei]